MLVKNPESCECIYFKEWISTTDAIWGHNSTDIP